MNARALAAVVLRIWGLILLLTTIVAVPGVLMGMAATPYPEEQAEFIHATQAASVVGLLAASGLGLFLLLWGDWVARRAIPETGTVALGVDAPQLLSVGLALVGAVILVHGLEDAVSLGYVLSNKPKWGDVDSMAYLWERQSDSMVRAVFNIVAGCVLLFGRNGLARAWAQVQSVARSGRGLTSD